MKIKTAKKTSVPKARKSFLIVGTAGGRHCVVNAPTGKIKAVPSKLWHLVLPFFKGATAPAQKFQKRLLKIMRQRETVKDLPFEFQLADGSRRILSLNAQPFFQSTDASQLILLTLEDLTHRRQVETARQHWVLELDALTHDLENRVDEGTAKLQEANQKLQTLSARMLEAQELERRHLARELHDEIGQQITCLQILTENQIALAPPPLKRALKETRRATTELLHTVRQLSADLRPQLLDDFGLVAALEWHFGRFQKRTGIAVQLNRKHFHDELLNSFLRNVIFRVAQEALTNVARHAETNRVNVDLGTRKGNCRLVVRDEGKGFNLQAALHKGSFGLSGMQERVFLAGGNLQFDSALGKGTTVAVELPLISVQTNAFEMEHPPEPS